MMEQKIKDLIESIVNSIIKLNKNLGISGVIKYLLLFLLVIALFNFKSVIRGSIGAIEDIGTAIHNGKLQARDELLIELSPLLSEYRTISGADRLLYFEYHNSKENLVGIPFKYLDLVLMSKKYGISEFEIQRYHELNAGILSSIFPDLRKTGYIINKGSIDPTFYRDHHEVADFIQSQDGSIQQVYINIPGVHTPIGIIILEWTSEEDDKDWNEIINISKDYVTRINGLVLSKSKHF